MADPRAVTAHVGASDHGPAAAYAGRIVALEGGGGLMRLRLDGAALTAGQECELEMHDGARFGVMVLEVLPDAAHEYRMKLLGKSNRPEPPLSAS
ncbi:hypothetical protein [Deinococcus sp.]|uniref:hypothetical protein n=1 Tax=Deinococcus sp. TaxID=47478 RepID=UPI003CC65CAB